MLSLVTRVLDHKAQLLGILVFAGSMLGIFLYFTLVSAKLPATVLVILVLGCIIPVLFNLHESIAMRVFQKSVYFLQSPVFIIKICNICYLLLLIIILSILQTYEVRPHIYIICILCMIAITAYLILHNKKTVAIYSHILKILVIYAISVFSQFKVYYWIGYDTWSHAAINDMVVRTAGLYLLIPEISKEVSSPIQHIAVAISEIIVSCDIRLASIIAVSLPMILLSITVFCIGRKMTNVRCALLAMLIYVSFSTIIIWTLLAQTTTYGYCLGIIAILCYFICYFKESNEHRMFYLCLFIGFVIILTHTFSTFIFFTILLAIYLSSIIRTHKFITLELKLFLSSVTMLLLYWIVTSWGRYGTVLEGVVRIALNSFSSSGSPAITSPISKYLELIAPSSLETIMNTSFMVIFAVSTLLILFICCKIKVSNILGMHPLVFVFIQTSVLYVASYVVITEMSERFGPYCCFFCALAITVIFYYYLHISPLRISPKICTIGIIILLIIMSFFLLGTTNIYSDNPMWMTETTTQNGVTVGDINGIKTFILHIDELDTAVTDYSLIPVYNYYSSLLGYNRTSEMSNDRYKTHTQIIWTSPNVNNESKYLVFRTSLLERPTSQLITYGKNIWDRTNQILQLNSSYREKLNQNNNLIYSNKYLEWYTLC